MFYLTYNREKKEENLRGLIIKNNGSLSPPKIIKHIQNIRQISNNESQNILEFDFSEKLEKTSTLSKVLHTFFILNK